jgi:thiol-disulfide isomerase/thioredoxin
MKQAPSVLVVFLSIAGLYSCQEKSAEDILRMSLAKIEKIKTVEQILVTEHFDSANYFFKIDTSAYYFDFRNAGKTSGSKFHSPGTYLSVERPTSNYSYDIAKVAEVGYGRKAYMGSAQFYFPIFGSIDAAKRFLPNFLSDSTIHITRLSDTTLNGKGKHYHIHCLLLNKCLQPGGELHEASYAEDHLQFSYDLLINKENGLPTEIVYKYKYLDTTKQGWKATTLRYDFSPQKPDSVWNLTSNPLNYIAYSLEDLREDRKERLRVQIINTEAPGWELHDLSGNIHSLDEFRDKLLLLEFWYIGCGGCHRSIPFLNQAKKQYGPAKFDVVGINFVYNTEKDQLKKYVKDSGINFLVLDNGALTAIKYKASAAPLILLIKNGTIVHAVEGYNDEVKAELTEMIEKHI